MNAPVLATPRPNAAAIRHNLRRVTRWRWTETLFWIAALASVFLLPEQHLILNEIAGLAVFVLSLDLILGFAGIVSLGQAAFFGTGAYAAGLFSKFVTGEPLSGLLVAGTAAAFVAFLTSFLVLRGSDLTRLMVTLGVAALLAEAANKLAWLTGGADGLQGVSINPIFGQFDFDLYGHTAYAYSLAVLFVMFLVARLIVGSPFGFSLRAIRDNPLRASAVGIPVNARLVAIYTIAGAYAGIAGALAAQTQQFVSLDVLSFQRSADGLMVLVIGGPGYLYGGLIGSVVYKLIQDGLSTLTPQFWGFWVGLLLVAFVLVGRDKPRRLVGRLVTRIESLGGRRRPAEMPVARTEPT
jgi:branched-chain amino acid transport system permease protein